MVEHRQPNKELPKVADSNSADARRKASVVAQKKRFFDLVITLFRQIATNADGTTSSKHALSGFKSRRLHERMGLVAQLVEQEVSSSLVVAIILQASSA